MRVTAEREAALEAIFGSPTGRKRTSLAAATLATEALDGLVLTLEAGDRLGDDYGPAQRDVDRAIRDSAIRLGCACLDGMRGMIDEHIIDDSIVIPRAASAVRICCARGRSGCLDLLGSARLARATHALDQHPGDSYSPASRSLAGMSSALASLMIVSRPGLRQPRPMQLISAGAVGGVGVAGHSVGVIDC